ncbi:MAG: hypothetical protein ACKO04_14200 [Actinomycetes bacterium]
MSTTRHGDANGTYDAPPLGAKNPWTSTINWIVPPAFDTPRSSVWDVFNGIVPVFVIPRPTV